MLQKLDGLQDKKYAGYCLEVTNPSEEDSDYYAVHIRPVQQGLTKPHPRKPQHARPTMCVPVLPATAHLRSREPLQVSKPLPWNNCYHPTCYDICVCIPAEQRDHSQSPYLNCSPELDKFVAEDMRYRQLLQDGLDDDRILRILDGQEEAPETDVPDGSSQTSSESQASQVFLAKVPGCAKLEEDLILVPVMRVDHVLSNVPEISDRSQLCGELDIFRE
ncbi:hypothetical protein ARMSODRAFT_947541 [Armillaria solidipes]|uniref:Uncharacterized protein n=1 Tax=Armillaria solidipes TaxID=1076256 RepID=A0A2H3C790_9AGAR|nr:hypothetical protein ARMSODRAFT_947541 [Armillaria solidipes]